jgi:hypothetical protein
MWKRARRGILRARNCSRCCSRSLWNDSSSWCIPKFETCPSMNSGSRVAIEDSARPFGGLLLEAVRHSTFRRRSHASGWSVSLRRAVCADRPMDRPIRTDDNAGDAPQSSCRSSRGRSNQPAGHVRSRSPLDGFFYAAAPRRRCSALSRPLISRRGLGRRTRAHSSTWSRTGERPRDRTRGVPQRIRCWNKVVPLVNVGAAGVGQLLRFGSIYLTVFSSSQFRRTPRWPIPPPLRGRQTPGNGNADRSV